MKDSILASIKKLLGLADDYDYFDTDIIMHINAALMVLTQLGVGPSVGFLLNDETTTWDDFLDDDENYLGAVKSYVYLKVKLMFDPPLSSALIESMNRQISELEWRINITADSSDSTDLNDVEEVE